MLVGHHSIVKKLLVFWLYFKGKVFYYVFFSFFCRKLLIDLCDDTLKPYINHPTRPDESLFLMFDFTHNFKNIFNNFISKGRMAIPTSGFEDVLGESCQAHFNHIKHLYALEEHKSLKIAHALKKVSFNPSNVARTSPQHASSK